MSAWFDKECERLDRDLDEGLITASQHKGEMRQLLEELRREADDAAESARNDVLGWY